MVRKLNTLLAIQKQSQAVVSRGISELLSIFTTRPKSYQGERKTYEAYPGEEDKPAQRGFIRVSNTVDEDFEYLLNTILPQLKNLLARESTNSQGANKVKLVVEEVELGEATALELMFIKNLLNNDVLNKLFSAIPVRDPRKNWSPSSQEDEKARGIFQDTLLEGIQTTSENIEEILTDPNLTNRDVLPANYTGVIHTRRVSRNVGNYTVQNFSGEWDVEQKAQLLKRLLKLRTVVEVALQTVNDTPVVDSNVDVEKMFDYLIDRK